MKRQLLIVTVALHALGVVAFVWPFLFSALLGDAVAVEQIAPIAAAILAGAVLFVAMGGRYSSHEVAVLGVLAGVNAVLRLPGSFGGASPMFALPIIVGATMGARAGFLLGSTSMLASALITGGVGPWLPFQALAMGWVGGGAGLVVRDRGPVPIALYGWFAGYAFGALLNLSFWPFQRSGSTLAFLPGESGIDNLASYWRFYLVTSLAWDSMRAIGNALLLGVLAAPVRVLLKESQSRGRGRWLPSQT
jgi:energy-coupling factor transport system substrate-specific component